MIQKTKNRLTARNRGTIIKTVSEDIFGKDTVMIRFVGRLSSSSCSAVSSSSESRLLFAVPENEKLRSF